MDAQRLGSGLGHGLRTALRNNLSAYGFSVMITASFGVLSAQLGSPNVGEVFLFAGGAVVAVTAIDGISSKGFRTLQGDPPSVVALGAALSFFSVGFGVGGAALAAVVLDGPLGWGLGSLVGSALYVLVAGVEMTLARMAQEEREAEEGEGEGEEDEEAAEGASP
jgi:hypothetical protein